MPTTIQTAGITDIQLPVNIRQRDGGLQHTVSTMSLKVINPEEQPEGLQEFTAVVNRYLEEISFTSFSSLLNDLQKTFHADSAELAMTFPYFLLREAPVTKTKGLMEYQCTFTGISGDKRDFILSVRVPVTTLCPCSKEISDFGAHNQRAEVHLNVRFGKFIWAEELIEIIEDSASCELYSVLKRPDEKYVTEKAYTNPMFVEDVVRKIAVAVDGHPAITWFSVSVESFESIHNHSAYAYVDSDEMRS